jgi:hypothetical protein
MTKTSLTCSLMLVVTIGGAACFNTKNVQSGGLKCAPSSDPNNPGECPDGFFCGEGHLCFKNGTEGVSFCRAGERPPFGPLTCSAPDSNQITSLCDPVCQTGCTCQHRCQLTGEFNGGYSFACETPPGEPNLGDFAACDGSNDLCKPGSACLAPPSESKGCVSRCYRYCRADSDCPKDSQCMFKIDLADDKSKVLICSPPAVPCLPFQNDSAKLCENSPTGDTCYVFSTDSPDITMCDCAGTIKAGDACLDPHSCVAGHECVGGICRKLCGLTGNAFSCPAGQSCLPYSNSTRFGTCQ